MNFSCLFKLKKGFFSTKMTDFSYFKFSSISKFPVKTLENIPENVKQRIISVQEKSGFVPNVFLALAHRPKEFTAFFDYHDALLFSESELTKSEKEMIIVATSAAN